MCINIFDFPSWGWTRRKDEVHHVPEGYYNIKMDDCRAFYIGRQTCPAEAAAEAEARNPPSDRAASSHAVTRAEDLSEQEGANPDSKRGKFEHRASDPRAEAVEAVPPVPEGHGGDRLRRRKDQDGPQVRAKNLRDAFLSAGKGHGHCQQQCDHSCGGSPVPPCAQDEEEEIVRRGPADVPGWREGQDDFPRDLPASGTRHEAPRQQERFLVDVRALPDALEEVPGRIRRPCRRV